MSDLEATFATRWRQLGGPDLEPQYRFAPPRRFAFDFAHVPSMTAIECDGGTWTGGRHTRGAGFARDCEKLNLAALRGWAVFRFTTDMLAENAYGHLMPVIDRVRGVTP